MSLSCTICADARPRARRLPAATVIAVVALATAVGGCSQLRGRRLNQQANELYKQGRYQEAMALFDQAVELVPELPCCG